jgi:hypothetical protein
VQQSREQQILFLTLRHAGVEYQRMSRDLLIAAGIVIALPMIYGALAAGFLIWPELFIGLAGLAVAGGIVRSVTIFANHRDDPRRAKRPLDPP